MTGYIGSELLNEHSHIIREGIKREQEKLLAPNKRKSDTSLRRFTVREASEHLKLNYNTLRHHLKNIEGMPAGIMEPGNRRTFSAEEMHQIQDILFNSGKIPLNQYPKKGDDDQAAIIAVYNLKGGVAKTSLCGNIATALALRGSRVLVIDLDPQASISDLFDIQPDLDGFPSIYDVLKHDDPVPMSEAISGTYFPNIDFVGGSLNMTEFEFEISATYMSGQERSTPWHRKISSALRPIQQHYDVILFDTPPHLSFAVIAAVFASNAMLIPVSTGMLDIVSLEKFLDLGSSTLGVVEQHEPDKRYNFIKYVLTKYSPHDASELQISSFLRSQLGPNMLRTDFIKSTAVTDAGITMQPVLEVGPSNFNRKTYERIYECIRGIADEIEEEMMKSWGREPVKGGV
ncbi:AAA family ATPase [Sulfitobacter sp. M220]|uniref:AAA family ATPase n=1 Tax=Sulfitobacter sp. M220 TaxID=2675333 RepID=UPI001F2AA17A|nr:AAA family ATPase [Sulfitobacter sp. M220]MCF7779312.1 AAA family ATPase [Sulfitobacter sp. M220]